MKKKLEAIYNWGHLGLPFKNICPQYDGTELCPCALKADKGNVTNVTKGLIVPKSISSLK